MPDLTPRDDNKKMVSEILKRVDQLIKGKELDSARQQIDKAKELDPKNVYIHAYEERLVALIEEIKRAEEIDAKRRAEEEERRKAEDEKRKIEEEKRRKTEEARKKAEEEKRRIEEEHQRIEEERRRKEEEKRKAEEARRRAEEDRRHQEEERKHVEVENIRKIDEARRRTDEERRKAEEPEQQPVVKKSHPDISWQSLEETKRRILDDRKRMGVAPLKVSETTKKFDTAYEEGLDIYRRMLMEVWADGAATEDEERQLNVLRSSLMIPDGDHETLEREAKLTCYTQAFRHAWSSGTISPGHASSLAELRKQFKITLDEHEEIEARLLWELRGANQRALVLLIDDDEKLLKVVSDTLEDAGFQTKGFTTSDEAFVFLKKDTPDVIISDINLETSTMGGFSFYEKVREIERLHEIPFIFLSGLTDEVLIRTGKELGVDDYITKPFSNDTLIATIKGRLKRYKQLKKGKKKA